VVAYKLGRRSIGFEVSPEYTRIAESRIAHATAQRRLFNPATRAAEVSVLAQSTMFDEGAADCSS